MSNLCPSNLAASISSNSTFKTIQSWGLLLRLFLLERKIILKQEQPLTMYLLDQRASKQEHFSQVTIEKN